MGAVKAKVLTLPDGMAPSSVRARVAQAVPTRPAAAAQRAQRKPAALHKTPSASANANAGAGAGASSGLPVVRSRREQRRLELAAYTGVELARLRTDVARGWPGEDGCRALGGAFTVVVHAWPPSKSNSYRSNGQGGFYTTREVQHFQSQLASAIAANLKRAVPAGWQEVPAWCYVPGRVLPVAARPLYGPDVEVDVTLDLYEPFRTRRDTDGAWKVVLDVLTATGVLHDDVQVGNPVPRRPECVGLLPFDCTIVRLQARPVASWARNPGGRPMNTTGLARAVLQTDPAHWLTLEQVLQPSTRTEPGPIVGGRWA